MEKQVNILEDFESPGGYRSGEMRYKECDGREEMRRRVRLRRGEVSAWRAMQRCILFFGPICVVPILLLLLVTTDSYLRPQPRNTFLRPQFASDTKGTAWRAYNMSQVAQRLEKRKKYLKQTCRKLGLDRVGNDSLHRPNPWEYFVDTKHKLVWCNVFKAASSSWMYNFNILAGYSPRFLKKSKVVPLNLARQRYPRPSLETLQRALNNSVSFLIVRHPLERVLSAYRDKLQFALPHTHHSKLGMEIVAKYRKKNPRHQKSLRYQRWPTFSEFVDYLVDAAKSNDPLDMHWTPVSQFCTPCLLNVQIIAHLETLHDEQHYLIRVAGLQGIIEPQWRNAGHEGQSSTHVAKYYSQLTRSQILQLYHIYRYDFELFNYTLSGYLELGRPDEDPSVLLAAITMTGGKQDNAPRIY